MPAAWPLLPVACSAALYLGLAGALAGEMGYPLDDAWIHQTYARNLARLGQWSFLPGVPSAGSTSPLWTALLAIVHRLPGDPRLWTYALGLACLAGTARATAGLSRLLFDDDRLARWTALAVLAEWHLVWAALSGMEILLYTLLVTLLLSLALGMHGPPRPFLLGLAGGLVTLARPEGLWLVGLAGVVLALRAGFGRSLIRPLALYVAGWLLTVAPYALLNWQLSGRLLPNTFYAKQVEYRVLVETIPLWRRFLTEASLPWIGAQILFWPGLAWLVLRAIARRERLQRATAWRLVPAIWAAGLVSIYALALPVTYQHGRYLMPAVPIVLLYGVWGFRALAAGVPRIVSRALVLSTGLLFLLFWLRGGLAYAEDTAIITCEMVGTARQLAVQTRPTDLIAAHDIGALGYYTGRPLLDLAGLVSPETIPHLGDERALLKLMLARGVTHVAVFPDWYPTIASSPYLHLVFQRDCPQTRAAGHQNLAVYIITNESLD